MKKVLILAYDFPPYVSVGGLRPYNWYRYFKEFDVEPIVITRQWGNQHGNSLDYIEKGTSNETIQEVTKLGTIFKTPYFPNKANKLMLKYGEKRHRILRKSISAFYEVFQFFFPVGPKVHVYKEAHKYLKHNKVDLIIATGDPFVLFHYAAKLSKKHNTPWIADYRDPWSQSFSIAKGAIQRKIDLFFEKRNVKSASSIVTVDKLFELKIKQLFPSKSYHIFPNGFDPIEMQKAAANQQGSEVLTFSFIGTIYRWHPIRQLLEDFEKYSLKYSNQHFELKFYGINNADKIEQLINEHFKNLKNKVSIIPKIPNAELLQTLAKDNVLILFNYYQFTGTKIYDYLGLQRKILLCYTESEEAQNLKNQYYFHSIETDITPQIDIINQTNSGIIVRDSAHLLEVLKDLYDEFQATGQIACDSIGVEKYSRKIQVEKLAELIKSI